VGEYVGFGVGEGVGQGVPIAVFDKSILESSKYDNSEGISPHRLMLSCSSI